MGIDRYQDFALIEAYEIVRVFEIVTAERMTFRIEILRTAQDGRTYSARYHRRAALKEGSARDGKESLAVWVDTAAAYVSTIDEDTAIVQAMGSAAKWSKEHSSPVS
jgi:hypothetical protein